MRSLVVAVLLAVLSGPAAAENSPLEQCALQWRDMATAGKTAGLNYRTFAAGCLKANTQTLPQTAGATPIPKSTVHGSKRAKTSMLVKRPNRMSVCAAQWRQMKAQNTTNGLTYRQWSSQCLRKVG
jgi:hypothetical protein